MRWQNEQTIREDFLRRSFAYLVENGLEKMSLRDLCKKTGISTGSVYYWFEDKEELLIEAAEYGHDTIAKQIFDQVYGAIDDIDGIFAHFLEGLRSVSAGLRFVQQVATSPMFGERMRKKSKALSEQYDTFAALFAEKLGCDAEQVKPIVYGFAAAVFDYVAWNDEERTSVLLKDLRKRLDTLRADAAK